MHRTLVVTLLFGLFICGFAQPAWAQSTPDQPLDFAQYMLPLEEYRLENGLRVILARDDSAPVVAVNLTYHVGGADDPQGRSGFAHLFEHMMFYGSTHVKKGEFDAYLTEIGAEFNAYTADDKTVYYTTAPANQLPLILWLESDRLASLVVSQEAFETERQVVIEEFNQRVANAPYGFASLRLSTLPFQGYAPYERPTIGNVAELNAATLTDVQHFFDTYYVPNNVTLAIVGDIDIAQTKLLVAAYFGKIVPGEPLTPILERYPLPAAWPTTRTEEGSGCQIGYEETIIDPLAELPALWGSVVTTQTGAADAYALALLGKILGDGESSRFQQNLVQEGLVSFAFAQWSGRKLGAGVMQFGLYPRPGDDMVQVYALLRNELDKVIESGVTEEELQRAKQQFLLQAITDFRGNVGNTAEWLQDYTLRFDDPSLIPQEIARHGEVTADDIGRVAQTYFCDRPLNLITVLKEGEAVQAEYPGALVEAAPEPANPLAALPPGVVSRAVAPASLPASAVRVPEFITFTLDNGLMVIFVEEHKTPEVNLRLYVGGSDTALPAAKQGVAELMTGLLTKGTTTRSADEIAATIEGVGGTLAGQRFSEFTGVFASGPANAVSTIFDLLADVTRNPTFPADQLELLRGQMLEGMRFDTTDPDTLADRQFARIAYPDHPYSFYATPQTVEGISTQDFVAFHSDYYRPNNALLVIVGDLTAEAAQAETARVFESWEAGNVPNYLDYPKGQHGDSTAIYLIDRPDAEQATIRVGNLAFRAPSADRYAFTLVNTALGGSGLASRLNKNLREDKGYTYGVYSAFSNRHDVGSFRVAGDVGTATAGDALAEILRELRVIRRTGVLTDELTTAKGMVLGQFTMGIADPATLAGELAFRQLYSIPLTEINTYAQTIENISVSEVLTAAKRHIDSNTPIIVVVGDAAVIRPQLQALLNVATVDVDGTIVEVVEAVVPPKEEKPAPSDCTCVDPNAQPADAEAKPEAP
jgi:zinc protease